jgi:hypothetical protein
MRIDRQGEERLRRRKSRPGPSAVVAAKEPRLARVPVAAESIHGLALRLEHVEVDVAPQRDRAPASAGVARRDQAEERRIVPDAARVAGPEEAIGTDDSEAHRVLVEPGDALGTVGRVHPEKAGVGGDEQRPVGRVAAEAVDVDDPWVARRTRWTRGVVRLTAARDEERGGDRGDQRPSHR